MKLTAVSTVEFSGSVSKNNFRLIIRSVTLKLDAGDKDKQLTRVNPDLRKGHIYLQTACLLFINQISFLPIRSLLHPVSITSDVTSS